jgi:hypothetical protein
MTYFNKVFFIMRRSPKIVFGSLATPYLEIVMQNFADYFAQIIL